MKLSRPHSLGIVCWLFHILLSYSTNRAFSHEFSWKDAPVVHAINTYVRDKRHVLVKQPIIRDLGSSEPSQQRGQRSLIGYDMSKCSQQRFRKHLFIEFGGGYCHKNGDFCRAKGKYEGGRGQLLQGLVEIFVSTAPGTLICHGVLVHTDLVVTVDRCLEDYNAFSNGISVKLIDTGAEVFVQGYCKMSEWYPLLSQHKTTGLVALFLEKPFEKAVPTCIAITQPSCPLECYMTYNRTHPSVELYLKVDFEKYRALYRVNREDWDDLEERYSTPIFCLSRCNYKDNYQWVYVGSQFKNATGVYEHYQYTSIFSEEFHILVKSCHEPYKIYSR